MNAALLCKVCNALHRAIGKPGKVEVRSCDGIHQSRIWQSGLDVIGDHGAGLYATALDGDWQLDCEQGRSYVRLGFDVSILRRLDLDAELLEQRLSINLEADAAGAQRYPRENRSKDRSLIAACTVQIEQLGFFEDRNDAVGRGVDLNPVGKKGPIGEKVLELVLDQPFKFACGNSPAAIAL